MKTSMNKKRIAAAGNMILTCLLSICLVAGSVAVDDPVHAASGKYKSPFTDKNYTINSRFSNSLVVNGVDISYWQNKKTDPAKAKKAGVDYEILRVTYSAGMTKKLSLDIDSKFENHYTKAKAAGVMTGVYVFSQAKSAAEARKEADYAVSRLRALGIGPEDLELPVYMDYEFYGGRLGRLYGLKKKDATNAAVAFCNRIKTYGYTPGIYASLNFYNSLIDTSVLAPDVDLWCAQYNSSCGFVPTYSKWQYSSSAKIDGMLNLGGFKGSTDVNFWFIDQSVAAAPITKIKGRTKLSVADAKNPDFTITKGSTTLKEGTDYIVGGIRNNAKGTGYAYIKGIGKYGGYALVPIKITSKSSGSTTADLNSKCANHLTLASSELSKYVGNAAEPTNEVIVYKKGKYYTVQESLNIRKGPGVKYSRVKRKKLSKSMKKKTFASRKYAVLKAGKKVKCKKIKGNWMKISGGWVCCRAGDEVYLK